jgi:hypothetical protein
MIEATDLAITMELRITIKYIQIMLDHMCGSEYQNEDHYLSQ